MGEDVETNKLHLIQRNVKFIPMPPPPPDILPQNKTAQRFNGNSTIFTAVLEKETLNMASIVVSDPFLVDKVSNPP